MFFSLCESYDLLYELLVNNLDVVSRKVVS